MSKEVKSNKEVGISNEAAFTRLLQWLSPGAEQAGDQYELLRVKLIKFFERRSCQWPDELADETLERVTHKLAQGAEIETVKPSTYCYGVARNVAREYWQQPDRQVIALDAFTPEQQPAIEFSQHQGQDSQQESQRMECLERCLQRLPPEKRDLVERYYQDATPARIQQRSNLAAQLGLTLATLHLRVYRIREQLSNCIRRCCKQAEKVKKV